MSYNFTNGDGERIFSPVYADVWDLVLKGMTGGAVKVYLALLMHTTQQDRTWYMSLDEIAEDAGVSRSTAADAKDRLIEAGLIVQAYRFKGNDGEYHIAEFLPSVQTRAKSLYKVNVRPPSARSENRTNTRSENRTNARSENRTSTRSPYPGAPTPDKPSPPSPPEGVGSNEEPEVWENLSLPIPVPDTNAPTGSPARPEIPDETPGPVTAPDRGEADTSPAPAPSPAPRPGEGRVPDKYTPEFEDWWSRYPKRAGKRDAFKAWWKVVRTLSPTELNAHTDRYAAWVAAGGVSEVKYVPAGSKWLNGERWLDELEAPKGTNAARAAERAAMTPERRAWEERIDSVFGDTPPRPEEANPFHDDGWDPGLVIDHDDAPEETP